MIGTTEGELGCSAYLREIAASRDGAPPAVDLASERRNGNFVRTEIREGRITACHDIADGGLLVAVAEMALAGNLGCTIAVPNDAQSKHGWLFGEDQGRYLVAGNDIEGLLRRAKTAGIAAEAIGTIGGQSLTVSAIGTISLDELRDAHEGWLPAYMGDALKIGHRRI